MAADDSYNRRFPLLSNFLLLVYVLGRYPNAYLGDSGVCRFGSYMGDLSFLQPQGRLRKRLRRTDRNGGAPPLKQPTYYARAPCSLGDTHNQITSSCPFHRDAPHPSFTNKHCRTPTRPYKAGDPGRASATEYMNSTVRLNYVRISKQLYGR